MSEEKVELARQHFERLNAEGPHGARHMRHPDIEVIDPPNFPDADRWVGEAAVWERVEGFVELGWDGLFRVEEYLDAGEEVVVVWRAMGRSAHGGGVPLDVTMVHLLLFENGKIRRIRQYLSRAEALDAAGLRE